MTPKRAVELYNGKIKTLVSVFVVGDDAGASAAGVGVAARSEDSAVGEGAEGARAPHEDPERSAATPTPAGGLTGSGPGAAATALRLGPGAEAFGNRLRKMAKHYEKWARRSGVTCFRVYDADLPDYAVAIDVYAGARQDAGKRWVHVAEYAPLGASIRRLLPRASSTCSRSCPRCSALTRATCS